MQDISDIAKLFIHEAIKLNASDIHFHPKEDHVDLYFRIHGIRSFQQKLNLDRFQHVLRYFKFTSGMDIGEQNLPQNGAMKIRKNSLDYYLRLSTLPSKPIESLALRILPQHNELSIDHLFLFPKQFKVMTKLLYKKNGLILFSGKTGSGKTTTMYSLLQTIQKEQSLQTVTLEHPIEKDIPNILQIEINQRAGLTYHKALQAVLRHDPDIILIGEILTEEVAKFAIEAALTGHLVLSTLHAKNAKGTIDRLLSMDIETIDLIQTLIGVVSLELLPISAGSELRRAAIAEILKTEKLINHIKRKQVYFETFNDLRKKAYAYGYLTEKDAFQEK